jgi:4-hydroxy-3-methylbut-2-enyl diphosphate reductase
MKMREIIRAQPSGFCMGVKRAVEIVEDETTKPGSLYTLGPIIHNSQVLDSLAAKGVITAEPGDCLKKGSRVVIRAHGVEPDLENNLKEQDITILDGTCPKVKQSHRVIEDYSSKGFLILILGDKNHGEVKGMAGRAKNYLLVSSLDEAKNITLPQKTLFICQTTVKQEEFDMIKEVVLDKNPHTVIKNAICPATKERQEAVRELVSQVDAMVIVGGTNSANTKRLYQTACEGGVPSFHIEKADDLEKEVFSYRKIGVSAGASTPEYIIDEVVERLEKGFQS